MTTVEAPKIQHPFPNPTNDWFTVDSIKLHDGGGGFVPNGIVLCASPTNELHPYVTWRWFKQPPTSSRSSRVSRRSRGRRGTPRR